MEKIAVVGAGAWGTTLALLLAGPDRSVLLWEKFPDYARQLAGERENVKFLPGFELPENLDVTDDLALAASAPAVVLVTPSFACRETAGRLAAAGCRGPVLVATKGLEAGSGLRMSQVVAEAMPGVAWSVLSGPTIAREVAAGRPTAAVCAGPDEKLNFFFQDLFSTGHFRLYTSADAAGVEFGGALKNPLAIAAGIVEGLGLGDNAKATLLCRGLAEMARLGTALGGQERTFFGLSGLGDLITTACSPQSRNHRFGVAIGGGQPAGDYLKGQESVVEGYHSARPALKLAAGAGVEMPIVSQVAAVLFEGKPPAAAVRELMGRPLKAE